MRKLIFNENIYGYHIDFAGHVNNIVYIQWLENGRTKLLEEVGTPAHKIDLQEGLVPVIIETQIKYKKPLFLHNKVTVELWLSKINNASVILDFRILDENLEICATAQQKGLFIDRKTMRPQRISQNFKDKFIEFLITK